MLGWVLTKVASVTTNTDTSDYNINLASFSSKQLSSTGLPPTPVNSYSFASFSLIMSSPTIDSSTKPTKSVLPTYTCSHYPQYMLRHPNPPPPFPPISFNQFDKSPKPPIHKNILPTKTLSLKKIVI